MPDQVDIEKLATFSCLNKANLSCLKTLSKISFLGMNQKFAIHFEKGCVLDSS